MLETIEINNNNKNSASIIWLHGLGADGHDFVPMVPELNLPKEVRFIFPHAPLRPVTLNGGMVMRAWYDIESLAMDANQDIAGIKQSSQEIEQLISLELERGIPSNRIILAGFSQGGAMALYTALRYPKSLGGIIALSSYMLGAETFTAEASVANQQTPIFMAHGSDDEVVHVVIAQASRYLLQHLGYQIEWHEYPQGHGVCEDEIRDLSEWLKKQL